MATWSTIFVSITIQALPFLLLGVLLSGALAALVRPGWLAAALPERDLLAVPAASLAGVALLTSVVVGLVWSRVAARPESTASALARPRGDSR